MLDGYVVSVAWTVMHPLMHFHRNYLQNCEAGSKWFANGGVDAEENHVGGERSPGGGFPWLSWHNSKNMGSQNGHTSQKVGGYST